MSDAIPIKIRFSDPVPGLFAAYQPVLGAVYDATYYPGCYKYGCRHTPVCLMKIKDKTIAIRKGEYERVE